LGKGAAFRAEAFPVPEGSTASTLEKLSCLMSALNASKVVLLGDLWHSKWARDDGTLERFRSWREGYRSVDVILTIGNHDARSGSLEEDGISVVQDYQTGPFVCTHHPEDRPGGYVLCGHLHPAAELEGKGRQAMRLPCFWICQRYAVLPAFGELTGTATVSPCESDDVFVIAAGKVLHITKKARSTRGRR
jgi:DNA ligase-associated metallophosphoesterase